jgi:hypothetical protein
MQEVGQVAGQEVGGEARAQPMTKPNGHSSNLLFGF